MELNTQEKLLFAAGLISLAAAVIFFLLTMSATVMQTSEIAMESDEVDTASLERAEPQAAAMMKQADGEVAGEVREEVIDIAEIEEIIGSARSPIEKGKTGGVSI